MEMITIPSELPETQPMPEVSVLHERSRVDVIAPPPGELFSETNDNSVAILLTYSTACVVLDSDAEVGEECRRAVHTRGLKRSSTFRNYTHSAPRFRALLTEGGAEIRFHREGFESARTPPP